MLRFPRGISQTLLHSYEDKHGIIRITVPVPLGVTIRVPVRVNERATLSTHCKGLQRLLQGT